MNRSDEISTLQIYRRLFKHIRPYMGRLIVGIVAGGVAGLCIYGLLHMSQNVFMPFVQKSGAGQSSALSLAVQQQAGLVQELAAKWGVSAAREDGRMTWQFFVLTVLAIPVLVVIRAVADFVNRYYLRWVGARVVRDIRDGLFVGLQSQSLKFFGKSDIGSLISRCTNDTAVVETVVSMTAADAIRAPIEIAAAAAAILTVAIANQFVGLISVAFIIFPLCILPIVLLGRRVKRHSKLALERVSDLVSRMHETFTGIRVIKAFNTEAKEAMRFRNINDRYFGNIVKALKAELLMTPMMECVGLLLGLGFFVMCYAYGVELQHIIVILLASVVIYRPMKQIARINANLQRGAAALGRIYEVLDMNTALKESAAALTVSRLEKGFSFEHVDFHYDDGGQQVLRDICMVVRKGSVVALVGETGSGKTTLASLLARFYDPTGGRVLLDDMDLKDIKIADLRRLIGIVTQETILFNDTIANNIAYGVENATQDQIVAAAKQANAHDFIAADRAGYDRVVGEKGFVLSGGERQRIAIARAILKDPPVLILDEATSALDTITERLVQEAIARVMKDRTVLAIAHRLSTVKHADQIILLENSRIAEKGTHDELYDANGSYRKLCDMQILDS